MTQMPPRRLEHTITQAQDGQEVNTLLRRTLGLSGTVLRRIKWLEDGITLDGVRVNVRVRVREGQTLAVRLTGPRPTSRVVPVEGPLDIVYEDADLVVLNKAPGVLVHPGHGHFNDTLGNYLMWHYRQTGDGSDFHPVHRLDKGTSGLLVIAKHAYAQEKLRNQLHTGDFQRVYLAVCDGVPPQTAGIVDAPIGPVGGSLTEREVRPDGKSARTRYKILQTCGLRTLVELVLDTGRTHQIRVHMAYIGCPLTGDFLYGTENRALISRTALHSARLELKHPVTKDRLFFSAALPADMAALIPKEEFL